MPRDTISLPDLPQKSFFRIGEVAQLTQTKAFVLRYWETEFPSLHPVKSPSGHRLYRRQDVETILEIKRLLYDEGFTIAGARRRLRRPAASASSAARSASSDPSGTSGASPAASQDSPLAPARTRAALSAVRDELRDILTLLNRE